MTIVLTIGLSHVLKPIGLVGKDASVLARGIAEMLLRAVPAIVAYLVLVRLIERRPLLELSRATWPAGVAWLFGGAALMAVVVGTLWLCGAYVVLGPDTAADWPNIVLGAGVGAAIGEELISRGVLFRSGPARRRSAPAGPCSFPRCSSASPTPSTLTRRSAPAWPSPWRRV